MHFQLAGATNSEVPPFGLGKRREATNSGMSIQHPMELNHPSFSLQFFNQPGHDGSEMETLIKFPRPEVSQLDDLSAVVTKCTNPNAFAELYTSPGLIPRSGCGSVNSILNLYSQDSIESYNNKKAHCMHREIGAKAAQPMPQFPCSESRGDRVEDAEDLKPLKRKRFGGAQTSASVLEREVHILSERQRRSGMNQLLSKMHSLLPDQTAKSDKISIVAETINYIHYLQQRLLICSQKCAGGADTGRSSHQTGLSSADTILSTTGSSDYEILPEITLKSHGSKYLFLTISCAKKADLLPSIILVVEGQNMEVVDAFVSTNDTLTFHCLNIKALHTLDAAGRKDLTDTLYMLVKSGHRISSEP